MPEIFESRSIDEERAIREKLCDRLRGFSHRRIAEDMGVSHVTVGNLLSGRQRMTIFQLSMLCQFASCTVVELLAEPLGDREMRAIKHWESIHGAR